MQTQSGYTFDFVKKGLQSQPTAKEASALLEYLCFFELNGDLNDALNNSQPELAVINNLVSRGLPTRPSLFIEKVFLKALALGEMQSDSLGTISTVTNESFRGIVEYLFPALHIIDSRVKAGRNRFNLEHSFEFDSIGSRFEESFLFDHTPRMLGEEWFQLWESQRAFTSIVNADSYFTQQRVDFSIEFPYPLAGKKGIIVEIDGPHHWDVASQVNLDGQRDIAATDAGWMKTLRIQTRNFDRIEHKLSQLTNLSAQHYFQLIRQNYQTPLYLSKEGRKALQLILSPFAIARVQKALVRCLLENPSYLSSAIWKIAVVERDVPCAAIAVADLMQQLQHLFSLQGKPFAPEIQLTVFRTPEFSASELNSIDLAEHFSQLHFCDIQHNRLACEFDILIDVSTLQRPGFSGNELNIPAARKIVIRSVHCKNTPRKFLTADIISYRKIVDYNPHNPEQSLYEVEHIQTLRYFLQNIFRKRTFRPGQIEILNKSLQGKSVIGLLPTGGGKSLTYQLAALLQPGVCLVVDPIKSLMKDQYDNLRKNQIDACNFINSSLKTREEKTGEASKLRHGEVLFCFISPERLQMKEFRDVLTEMNEEEIYFNYCVIDEAHCVSEWGHDFRTSYLSLGKNAIEFCKVKNRETVPIFGLTATASFDVLSDVQRELSGNNERHRLPEDAVIQFDTVNREELNFEVVDVTADLDPREDDWELKKKLGGEKQSVLIDQLRRFEFDDQNQFSGIVFCPHRTWYFGVTDRYKERARQLCGVYDYIKRAEIRNLRLGSFMGSDADDERTQRDIESDSIQYQDDFVNNRLNLLVSTKAFGMGIDKPNIRFTVHVNYPGSIESFVQEAGRAGRDREKATCYILFNDEKIEREDRTYEIDRDHLLYFHNASFKGAEKENAILFELLTAIYTPDKLFEIEQQLYEQFQQEINLALWQSQAGFWYLFVNGESFEDKLGAVKLRFLEIDTSKTTRPSDECVPVLTFIQEFIQQNVQGEVISWLKTSSTVDGLETLLQANHNVKLNLRFENNITERIDKVSRWLNRAFDTAIFNTLITKNFFVSSNSFEDFKEHVTSKLDNDITFEEKARERDRTLNNPEGTAERELERLFNGYRTKADTEKALYRLSTVGVIDDYIVDFNSKSYTVYARRKTEGQYFQNLERYIRKYYSEIRTRTEIARAREFEGTTEIKKCLFFLTDFIYREIAKKRFEGIGVMKGACQVGKEKGGAAFKEFVELYFNSKYARGGYEVEGENKSLSDRTEQGMQQQIGWVWEFIEVIDQDKSGGHINNLKHLRGACVRLLVPQPDNAVFHLLKSFSIFILEPENERLLEEASISFLKGFIEFMKTEKWTFTELLESARRYLNYVLEFSEHPGIQEIMDTQLTILSVKIHSEWLENFNHRFLEKYEPRYSYAP